MCEVEHLVGGPTVGCGSETTTTRGRILSQEHAPASCNGDRKPAKDHEFEVFGRHDVVARKKMESLFRNGGEQLLYLPGGNEKCSRKLGGCAHPRFTHNVLERLERPTDEYD